MSIDLLIEKIKEKNNPCVFGLDPELTFIPKFIRDKNFKRFGKNIRGAAEAIYEFNCGLIDALCDVMPAVKPQSAFYEMYGPLGVEVLDRTMRYARDKGLYVIVDAKRNDIGSTAQAYTKAYLSGCEVEGENIRAFNPHSITVNAYLGTDGIEPFLKPCRENEASIFVLVKTSNQSSGELQDKLIGDKHVYEIMAEMVKSWGSTAIGKFGYSNVGAVIGATYPEQLKSLRILMPQTYFLVPGYGAQGGKAADVAHAFNRDGLGALINSSRGIMCAYQKGGYAEEEFAQAARAEALRMRDEILNAVK
jgi:orotidine-5'-phosphate decarboxylase